MRWLHKIGNLCVNSLKDRLGSYDLPGVNPAYLKGQPIITKYTHGIGVNVHLLSSIDYVIKNDAVFIRITAPYFEYLEYGTPNPTTPEEIIDWVNLKIMPKVKFLGDPYKKEKMKKRIAESIAAHITLYGPRPFPFFRYWRDVDLPKIMEENPSPY